jgi:hypothetical protein
MRRIYFGVGVGDGAGVEGFAGGVGVGDGVFDVPVAVGGFAPPMPDEGTGFTGVASGAGAAVGVLDNRPVFSEDGVPFGRFASSSVSAAALVRRA